MVSFHNFGLAIIAGLVSTAVGQGGTAGEVVRQLNALTQKVSDLQGPVSRLTTIGGPALTIVQGSYTGVNDVVTTGNSVVTLVGQMSTVVDNAEAQSITFAFDTFTSTSQVLFTTLGQTADVLNVIPGSGATIVSSTRQLETVVQNMASGLAAKVPSRAADIQNVGQDLVIVFQGVITDFGDLIGLLPFSRVKRAMIEAGA